MTKPQDERAELFDRPGDPAATPRAPETSPEPPGGEPPTGEAAATAAASPGTSSPTSAVATREPAAASGNGKHEDKPSPLMLMLQSRRASIARVLPKHLDVDKLITLALVAASRDPKLMECTPASILKALMISAQLGLEPQTPAGHGWILPYWNGKIRRTEAQWQTGYKGYIELAQRSGRVASVSARVVYEHDAFEYEYGTTERLRHVPTLEADRGKPVCAYAIARLKGDAEPLIEVVPAHEIERIRNLSKSADSPAWAHHWEMMARKTAVRRLANYLPQSAELSTAMELENRFEQGQEIGDLVPLLSAIGEDEPKGQSRTDQLKRTLGPAAAAAAP